MANALLHGAKTGAAFASISWNKLSTTITAFSADGIHSEQWNISYKHLWFCQLLLQLSLRTHTHTHTHTSLGLRDSDNSPIV